MGDQPTDDDGTSEPTPSVKRTRKKWVRRSKGGRPKSKLTKAQRRAAAKPPGRPKQGAGKVPKLLADPSVYNVTAALPADLHTVTATCQHPNARNAGICSAPAIREFDVPDDYTFDDRHPSAGRTMPRPKAMLCRRHGAMLTAKVKGTKLVGNSHEAMCAICQHPRGKHMLDMWENWEVTTTTVLIELNITHQTFYSHVHYFKLDSRKAAKPARKRLLMSFVEKGMASGGHSAKTALQAIGLLQREDPPAASQVKIDHSITGAIGIGVLELGKMTEDQLAAEAEEVARQLREIAAAKAALPSGALDDRTIDLGEGDYTVEPVAAPTKQTRQLHRDRVQHGRR